MIEDGLWLYLDLEDIRWIVKQWGLGPIQDARKLDSACARPWNCYGDHEQYTDATSKAAALGWGLVKAHGLVDGNKRLGAIATLSFLHINGFDVAVTEGELLTLFLQISRDHMDQEELCLFLRSRAVLAPPTRD